MGWSPVSSFVLHTQHVGRFCQLPITKETEVQTNESSVKCVKIIRTRTGLQTGFFDIVSIMRLMIKNVLKHTDIPPIVVRACHRIAINVMNSFHKNQSRLQQLLKMIFSCWYAINMLLENSRTSCPAMDNTLPLMLFYVHSWRADYSGKACL
jgi:hypothetical protein